MDALVAEWWPLFFRSYIGGEIYGVGHDVFTGGANLSGSWTVDDGADSVATFSTYFPDLSARLYLVDLSYPTIGAGADLMLRISGRASYQDPWGVMAFGVGPAGLEYWGHAIAQGSASLQVPGLKALYDAGWRQILAVAICSNVSDTYLRSTAAEFEIRVVDEAALPGYNSFDFGLHVVGHWRHVIGSFSNDYEEVLDLEPWGFLDVIPGEMTGPHEFRGSFASQGATGDVVATLNAAGDTLLSVSLEMDWPTPSSGSTRSSSFIATQIPRSSEDEDWSSFMIRGDAVCDYLDAIQYRQEIPSQAETKTLTGYHCTGAGTNPSALSLRLHKRPR